MTVTGWTNDYIAHSLSFEEVEALQEYWKENPPVHLLVKWYVGYKPEMLKLPEEPAVGKTGTIVDLLAILGQGPIHAGTMING